MHRARLALGLGVLAAATVGVLPATAVAPAASTATASIACSVSVHPTVSGLLLIATGNASCGAPVRQHLVVDIQTQAIRGSTTPLGAGLDLCTGCTALSAAARTLRSPTIHDQLGAVDYVVGPTGSRITGAGCTTLVAANTAVCAATAAYPPA